MSFKYCCIYLNCDDFVINDDASDGYNYTLQLRQDHEDVKVSSYQH